MEEKRRSPESLRIPREIKPGRTAQTMTQQWNQLEGVSLDGRYPLEQILSESAADAWYLTRLPDGAHAAMRVIPASHADAARQLESWRAAMTFQHPHVVRMFDAGRTEFHGQPFVFCVCEYPDDFLAGVLKERPLSPAETREVLRAALEALRFLHHRGYAHGCVDPSYIMAFGEVIKLPSDSIRPAAPRSQAFTEDVWSLGMTLHECLTGQRPNLERESDFLYLAEPFATILRHTAAADPSERWTIDDIDEHLHPPVRRSAPPLSMKWVPLIGLGAALMISPFLLRKSEPPRPAPPVSSSPAPAPAAAKPETSKPAPFERSAPPAAGKTAESAIWRVVAWTYSSRAAAEKKVQSLNRKSAEWHAAVFTPHPGQAPYYVSLGGRMSHADARQLQQKAIANGLPRDTFVRNFSH